MVAVFILDWILFCFDEYNNHDPPASTYHMYVKVIKSREFLSVEKMYQ